MPPLVFESVVSDNGDNEFKHAKYHSWCAILYGDWQINERAIQKEIVDLKIIKKEESTFVDR